MLTLFTQFRKWPEYKDSSFLASFENSMLKLETSAEESVEGIAEDDDNDDLTTQQQTASAEENLNAINNEEPVETSTAVTEEKIERPKKIKRNK